jgi:choline dehydrogenase-like flavoprotein
MLIDARELPRDAVLQADVAIIGAGAAGITLAHQLSRQNRSVLLLESGSFQYEPETQALYDGTAEGPALDPAARYLASSRLRYFGGTTNHWGGWCRPLDPIDFEAREGVPHSGWPITRVDLEPYYRLAESQLGLPSFELGTSEIERSQFLLPESTRITTRLFQINAPRYRTTLGVELADSEARVVTRANLLDVVLDESGTRVDHLELASMPERRLEARASCYLLATGGIENARLLLASNGVQSQGVGNAGDLVGRFFMEHPHSHAGEIFLTQRAEKAPLYVQRKVAGLRQQAVFTLSEAELRRSNLPNASLTIIQPRGHEDRAPGLVGATAEVDRLRSPGREPYDGFRGQLYARWEQRPNPESRVTLDAERDALGMPRARLRWELSSEDARTVSTTLAILTEELGRWASGRGSQQLDSDDPWASVVGGAHHMGTTRMATSPGDGVVDSDCRVFGVDNLWVAGSSVFPTVGFANPTLTLLALSYRLAEHIDSRLERL